MSDTPEQRSKAVCRSLDIQSVTASICGHPKTFDVEPVVAEAIRAAMADARSAALEEAAKVAEDRARLLSEWVNNAMANERSLKAWPEQCATATDIASAIRSLKDKT